ncbi:Intradiol ring-cleavage dioxygenase [Leucosporidium creatinivorum]|uniref:Intradiol ring-cleavage dioxygenase n=1 Tax=Leucosporidium creatinivorum TaxID=106004 RepID=A0A1Y2G1S3_9BASI|nr:Intradiol ring-cleavage dioxygenase [Leucosporidium creatinivorum]
MKFTSTVIAVTSLFAAVSAHGPETPQEVAEFKARQESIYHCAPKIKQYVAARKAAAQQALGGAAPTDASTMFIEGAFDNDSADKKTLECSPIEEAKIRNHTCVLSPETTQGPYYHDRGHPIRQNMAEDQLGLLFLMDVGVIDVKTCEPLPDVLVDLWHANATGHYAGHPEQEEALKWEGPEHQGPRKGLLSKYPRTEPEQTFLRGAWPTNKNGLSQFTSIFPGYYTGRATHVHVKVHTEWEPHANGTFTSSHLIHTGQFFVDDAINQQLDKMWPYNTNPIVDKWGRTRNWDDSLQIYQDSHKNGYGPTFEIEKLGGVIQQGLIAYITVGVDRSASYNPTEAWSP